jgi:hypothetical protein
MFCALDQNRPIAETLKDYIEKKLRFLGGPDYAYTVVSKQAF